MSTYIRIPNRIAQLLTTRDKLTLIVVYAYIRSQIKDASNTASITEEELAERCQTCLKSAWNHIQSLIDVGLITIVKKQQGEAQYPYNVYKVEYPEEDFAMIKPELLTDPNLSTEQKGLLILLKIHCHAGTNHINDTSERQVHKILKIDRYKIGQIVKQLDALGHIKIIGRTLIITDKNILLYQKEDPCDEAYMIIYKFCLLKGVVPPIKGERKSFFENMSTICENFWTKEMLAKALIERFRSLPSKVTVSYFCEALCNKHYLKKEREKLTFKL